MSICAIIPVAFMQSANDALEQRGFGPSNFRVPLYGATGATFAGLHAWNDATFSAAVKSITGVIWEESEGEPTARFQALVEAQGVKWGANAPSLPKTGMASTGKMYRDADGILWGIIQPYNLAVYQSPKDIPALIRQVREVGKVYEWKQPIDQFDAYKVLNPFTRQNDECMFNGKKYYVTAGDAAGNNVWSPTTYGWSLTDPTPLQSFTQWFSDVFL